MTRFVSQALIPESLLDEIFVDVRAEDARCECYQLPCKCRSDAGNEFGIPRRHSTIVIPGDATELRGQIPGGMDIKMRIRRIGAWLEFRK